MEGHLKKLKSSIDAWAAVVKINAEQELARVTFLAVLEGVVISDKLLLWILGITGLTISLSISHMSEISRMVGLGALRSYLFLLVLSGIMGFFSKGLSFYVNIYRSIINEILKLTAPIFERYNNEQEKIEAMARSFVEPPNGTINMEAVLKELSDAYGPLERRLMRASFNKAQKDPLHVYKRAVILARWHGYCLVVQALLFIAAFVVVIHALN